MTTPIGVQLLHHRERAWAGLHSAYTSLRDLETAGVVTVDVGTLPQQNSHAAFAELPESLRRLLFFAKPDLVVTVDDGRRPIRPIFALDVTEHVAARDHWIQRFPNLVGCAQEGIPGAFVAPRDMPARRPFAGRTDPFFFFAYDRVVEIHQTPIYIAEWPSTDGASLDGDATYGDLPPHDAPSIARTIAFFDMVLDAAVKGLSLRDLMTERMIVDLRNDLRQVAYRQIPAIGDFQRLTHRMPAGRPLTHAELLALLGARGLQLPPKIPDRIVKRDRNIVFTPVLVDLDDAGAVNAARATLRDRIARKGGDPYTQQPLVFDYLFCRTGPTPEQRDANLVIDLGLLYFADFAQYVRDAWERSPLQATNFADIRTRIPTYTLHLGGGLAQVMKNFVRLYSFAADLIVFRDGVVFF